MLARSPRLLYTTWGLKAKYFRHLRRSLHLFREGFMIETATQSSGMDMGSGIQKELDPLENARLQFEEAAARLKLDPSFIQIIKEPRRATIVKLPVQMDDGSF